VGKPPTSAVHVVMVVIPASPPRDPWSGPTDQQQQSMSNWKFNRIRALAQSRRCSRSRRRSCSRSQLSNSQPIIFIDLVAATRRSKSCSCRLRRSLFIIKCVSFPGPTVASMLSIARLTQLPFRVPLPRSNPNPGPSRSLDLSRGCGHVAGANVRLVVQFQIELNDWMHEWLTLATGRQQTKDLGSERRLSGVSHWELMLANKFGKRDVSKYFWMNGKINIAY